MSVEWFSATSGRVVGWIGVGCGALIVAVALIEGLNGWGLVFGLAVGLFSWVALLRPRLGHTDSHVVLRNMLSTVNIAWPVVRTVTITRFTIIWVGEKRYVNSAVGHTLRTVATKRGHLAAARPTDYASYVETLIRDKMESATGRSVEGSGIRRSWAWPEIAALAVLVAAAVALAVF